VVFVPVKRQHVPPQVSGYFEEQVAAVYWWPSAGAIRALLFNRRHFFWIFCGLKGADGKGVPHRQLGREKRIKTGTTPD
jgi:hypothetical protein